MDRRRFIQGVSGLTGAFAVAGNTDLLSASLKTRVSFVRDLFCISSGLADENRVASLFDRLIRIHYDVSDPADVFASLFNPHDRIGIKVNCLSGKRMSTHTALVNAITGNLINAGIPADNIVIWDRLNSDLRSGWFSLNPLGKQIACAGCDVLGYESNLTVHRSIGSLFAKAVTSLCTATINVPVLKDHGIVGVTLGMKNMFGAIHNPNKYHPNRGNPYVADLYSHPDIGGKIRRFVDCR